MIICVHGHERALCPSLFDQMFALRASCYAERRRWRVTVPIAPDFVRDPYDGDDALYLMAVSDAGNLEAALRLLPTTGPHLLAGLFPPASGDNRLIRHPLVWECAWLSVDAACRPRDLRHVAPVTRALVRAMFDLATENGLWAIVWIYDLPLERILRRAGCVIDRLGSTFAFNGIKTAAGLMEVSPRAKNMLSRAAGTAEPEMVRPPFHGDAVTGSIMGARRAEGPAGSQER